MAAPSRRDTLGGKAAGLRVLEDAGCRVPEWEVLDTSHASENCGTGESGSAGPLTDRTRHALARIADALGPGPLAVRSSATVEDGDERSWAGAFATVLGVHVEPDDRTGALSPTPSAPAGIRPPAPPGPVDTGEATLPGWA